MDIAAGTLAQNVKWLRLALSNGPNREGAPPPFHMRMQTIPVSKM